MLRFNKAALLSLTLLLGLAYSATLLAEPPFAGDKVVVGKKRAETTGKFLRLKRNQDREPTALETPIVRYVPASGDGDLVVDLIGAVHIGDASYYNTLNKQFEQYDVLLYELVAPKGTVIPKGGRKDSDNPLAMIMDMAQKVLNLRSQTKMIDYTKPNFVHADMSPSEMMKAVKKRGDDGLTLLLSVTADLLRQQNLAAEKAKNDPTPGPKYELDPLSLILDPNASVKLKRMMSEQFDSGDVAGGLGSTLNTILIKDRNAACMRVFQTELAKGKKRIGIFYGAAHLPDFHERLTKNFGLKRAGEHWLTAWDMKIRGDGIQDVFTLPRK